MGRFQRVNIGVKRSRVERGGLKNIASNQTHNTPRVKVIHKHTHTHETPKYNAAQTIHQSASGGRKFTEHVRGGEKLEVEREQQTERKRRERKSRKKWY